MKNIILFDDNERDAFLPLVYNRPIGELKIGILTIREKWETYLGGEVSYITQDYLTGVFPITIGKDNIVINSRALPTLELVEKIKNLEYNEAILKNDYLLAVRLDESNFRDLIDDKDIDDLEGLQFQDSSDRIIRKLTDLCRFNGSEIERDFELITEGRKSQELHASNIIIGDGDIFVEEGATVLASTLNTTEGPIYIGKDAKVEEGSHIRGPVSIGEKSVVKMGARIYPDTTLGTQTRVGGEVNNSIIMDYSNKGHEGFLGNSVLGSWCNLGADTNTSNLKNNYSEVRQWSYKTDNYLPTGTQFCGLVMGDHSKAGINTMFNTGTVVGLCANVFDSGFPPKFIPSFSWGGNSKGWTTYDFEKAMITVQRMMNRRDKELDEGMLKVLAYIFERTRNRRKN